MACPSSSVAAAWMLASTEFPAPLAKLAFREIFPAEVLAASLHPGLRGPVGLCLSRGATTIWLVPGLLEISTAISVCSSCFGSAERLVRPRCR
jgi:hypothetical protein